MVWGCAPSTDGWRHERWPTAPPGRPWTEPLPDAPGWTRLLPGASMSPPLRLLERNLVAWRGMWLIFISVMVEPIFFLFSIGIGVGKLVGDITLASGQVVSVPRVRGRGPAGLVGHDGSGLRLDLQLLREAEVHPHLPGHAGHPDGTARPASIGELLWSLVRASLYAAAFLVAIVMHGPDQLVVGAAVRARGPAHRLRVRRRRARGHHLHALVHRLRPGEPGHHPHVPVLGHVLPGQPVPDRPAVGGAVHAALPGRGAGTGAAAGRRRVPPCWCTSCTWRSWAPSACGWPAAGCNLLLLP